MKASNFKRILGYVFIAYIFIVFNLAKATECKTMKYGTSHFDRLKNHIQCSEIEIKEKRKSFYDYLYYLEEENFLNSNLDECVNKCFNFEEELLK